MEGKLIIFSAPSGAGKTTIVKWLLEKFNDKIAFSISASTREPRDGEVNGKDYYFITKEEFLHRIAKKEFVEFEEVYSGTFYGTLRAEIERIWMEGKAVIFDIDVIGGLHLKKKFGENALAIFVQPPSLDVLVERLRGRGTDTEEKLKERIEKAGKELAYAEKFDVILKNDDLDKACQEASELLLDFLK
ncbi:MULTISPECIES: guanylate kinase [Olivibacter]|jgi:guanylate kinase|uniref:Guanylate kinase n=3 Tax=Sphingobacteriaceae TaxID=84566 RepID=F4C397_SPHS2|nr:MULTISPECIES: guanylate kinase [Olivibacter]MCL4638785.1 guanylate kinase [Olivibacter sp. UJ_SKK_5.1]MDM8177650.1 guanylate kinase [Olivibacter sp. 47]MDX3912370.1 guanylate kinase [Pseudosphingobacterium sp.]QEL00092.1 guanylate kinase [Olivibacter sp. LS-1]